MKNFSRVLDEKVLVMNNSISEILKKQSGSVSKLPALYNLLNPELVLSSYKRIGEFEADIVVANTFQAIHPILKKYNAESGLEKINVKGIELARSIFGDKVYIAGHIGTAELSIEPFGEISFDEAVDIFTQQIKILLKSNIDLLFIDQMDNIQEARAAVIASNELRGEIPIVIHANFGSNGLMTCGTDIETFAVILESLNADVIGIRCQPDPLPVVNELEKHTNCFLSVSLNENDNLESFLEQANVNIISTASLESINIVSELSKGKKVAGRTAKFPFRFTSASKTVRMGSGLPFIKIGERINPTGRKALTESLSEGKIDIILKDALTQSQSGADALDVNVGAPLVDEPEMMKLALKGIQQKTDLPLVIDSSSPQAIENGLKMYAGKALVNSINAKEETLSELLPIIKKYGASVIALSISDFIPENAEKRLELAKFIVNACKNFGIKESNIIIDVAALAIGTIPDSGQEVLHAIKKVKNELKLPVSIGVSNTSFGLPERNLIHNTFLAMAMAMGLDAGILNVLDPQIHELIAAASMFCGRDKYCMNYIKMIRSKKK